MQTQASEQWGCGAFVVDPIASCVQEEGNTPRLKLPAQLTALAVKDGDREVGMVDQCQTGAEVRGEQDLSPFCLERTSEGAGDNPRPLND